MAFLQCYSFFTPEKLKDFCERPMFYGGGVEQHARPPLDATHVIEMDDSKERRKNDGLKVD
jgi:hypothetical protein